MIVPSVGFEVSTFETTEGTDGIRDKAKKGGVDGSNIGVWSGGVSGPREGVIGIGDCTVGLMLKMLLLGGLAGFNPIEAVGLTLKI